MCASCGCVLAGTGIITDDHGDPRNITAQDVAAAADAAGISPGQAAANTLATLRVVAIGYPDDEGCCADVAKGEPEQRYALAVAYQPGQDPRIAKGVDGGRDWFSEAELEKAAHSYLRNGPRVGMFHVDGTDQQGLAEVVESYIYRGPDWDLGDGIVVRKGTWLVGMILSPEAWALHKAGKLNGVSPQGTAKRRRVVPAA